MISPIVLHTAFPMNLIHLMITEVFQIRRFIALSRMMGQGDLPACTDGNPTNLNFKIVHYYPSLNEGNSALRNFTA